MSKIEASMHTSPLAIAGLHGSGSNELERSSRKLNGHGTLPVIDGPLAVIATRDHQIRSLPAIAPSTGEASEAATIEKLLQETDATIAEATSPLDPAIEVDLDYDAPSRHIGIDLNTPGGPVLLHPNGFQSVMKEELRATSRPPKLIFERRAAVVAKREAKKEELRQQGERIKQQANDFGLRIAEFHEALGFYPADQINSLNNSSPIVGRIVALVEKGSLDEAERSLNMWIAQSGMDAMDTVIQTYRGIKSSRENALRKQNDNGDEEDNDEASTAEELPLNVANRRHNKELAHGARTGGSMHVRPDLLAKGNRKRSRKRQL